MRRKLILSVIAVVVVAACGAYVLLPRVAHGPMAVTAQFEDAVGLYEGNAVSVLGMQVGHVASIVPKGGYVEVTLAIDNGVDVPADVHAVTVSTSILTDRHIELTPAYRSGPKLRNGDVLSLTRTRTPVEFDKTLAMVNKLATALRGDGQGGGPVADLVDIGSKITTGNGPDIKATLDQLSQALRLGSDNGAHAKEQIQAIVNSLDELTQSATDNDTAIRQFGSNIHQLSDVLAAENLGTGTTGAKINQILAQATSLLEKNRDGLKNTTTDFRTVTTAMVDYRRELAEFFDVAPLAIDNVWNTIDPDTGVIRAHASVDKLLANGQMGKEVCNLLGLKQLSCATGTLRDYGPDFGVTEMLELMAGVQQ
jgi:phospholipid/cholesterol/gamma-HCH transport system substrate-binding protein